MENVNQFIKMRHSAILAITVVLGLSGCSAQQSAVSFSSVQGTALHVLQPALAVRAMACVTCHANISSNIMTDSGYGNSYFFYNNAAQNVLWNRGSVYGDHGAMATTGASGGAWWSAIVNSSSTIYVPNATLPSYVQNQASFNGAVHTLSDYLKYMLSLPGGGSTDTLPQIKTLSQMYIGAPTKTQILQAFNGMTTDFLYKKSQDSSPNLTGLVESAAKVFVADGALTCDGDLFINGTILLSNVQLNSNTGCHIYASKTVFISGPISYLGSAQANLQISSSRAISLGLGDTASSCDPGEFATLQSYVAGNTDTVALRFKDMWTVPGYITRDGIDPAARGLDVVTDATSIRTVHVLKDAMCEPQGRAVSFQRLLLNAPNIQSRYNGEFKGAIIAEIFIGALGDFQYIFDPVFSSVPVLPFLDPSVYLSGQ